MLQPEDSSSREAFWEAFAVWVTIYWNSHTISIPEEPIILDFLFYFHFSKIVLSAKVFVSFFSGGVQQHTEKVNQTGQVKKEKDRLTRLTSEFSFSFPISFCCLGLAKP